ncbi:hypothetical protein [Pseudomonas moraviensis]|uniref:hypothetical protein n=1 Tax=Pseudomonas moraviensis TaxID=321662 RepID=UPI00105A3DA9|nr:hypothetical protein [Pseudomonas moraviensis]TDK55519.1 hypothetical protein E1508_08615 [Pseudomonas moraviensis]
MNNLKATQLGIDESNKPLSFQHTPITQEGYYKATFEPEFPPITSFKPNQYFYESFTENSVSVIARHQAEGVFYQLGFVLPRKIESGGYDIEDWGDGKVSAHVIAEGVVFAGKQGKIDLTRTENLIVATFNFEITHGGTLYKVQNGKLSLEATGDL